MFRRHSVIDDSAGTSRIAVRRWDSSQTAHTNYPMTTHDNADPDEQCTTDDPNAAETGSPTREGTSVPMVPQHGPRPGHLT